MKARLVLALSAWAAAGCSHSHIFEVSAEDAREASLTIYNETTAMDRSGSSFIGHRSGGDGSGHIDIVYPDGRRLSCPIGYVTSGEPEPHRYVIRNGQCRQA